MTRGLGGMLRTSANALPLGEPASDLDGDTLRVLEDAPQAFTGCAPVMSHDRPLLARVATHRLAFEGVRRAERLSGERRGL